MTTCPLQGDFTLSLFHLCQEIIGELMLFLQLFRQGRILDRGALLRNLQLVLVTSDQPLKTTNRLPSSPLDRTASDIQGNRGTMRPSDPRSRTTIQRDSDRQSLGVRGWGKRTGKRKTPQRDLTVMIQDTNRKNDDTTQPQKQYPHKKTRRLKPIKQGGKRRQLQQRLCELPKTPQNLIEMQVTIRHKASRAKGHSTDVQRNSCYSRASSWSEATVRRVWCPSSNEGQTKFS